MSAPSGVAVQMDLDALQSLATQLGLVAAVSLALSDDAVRSAARQVEAGHDLARGAGRLTNLHVEVQELIRTTSSQAGRHLAQQALRVGATDAGSSQLLRLPMAGR